MAWIEPKTDWTSSDYFNAEDYNRIIGNVIYLKAFSDALFNSLTNVSLGEEKTKISQIIVIVTFVFKLAKDILKTIY